MRHRLHQVPGRSQPAKRLAQSYETLILRKFGRSSLIRKLRKDCWCALRIRTMPGSGRAVRMFGRLPGPCGQQKGKRQQWKKGAGLGNSSPNEISKRSYGTGKMVDLEFVHSLRMGPDP